MKHQIISMVCCLAVALSGIPAVGAVSTTAATTLSGTCGAQITWELHDHALYLTGSGAMDDLDVAINHGFASFHDVIGSFDTVVVGEGITSIGERAFKDYDGIRSVVLPDSLREIGAYAFYNTGLRTVILPENVETIGAFAFSACQNLTEFQVADGNTVFRADGATLSLIEPALTLFAPGQDTRYSAGMCGEQAWYTCDGETLTVQGSGSVTDCPWMAFVTPWQENTIRVIEIGSDITEIGPKVFQNHYQCQEIRFAPGSRLNHIGASAFEGNHVLTTLTLPDSVQQIDSRAFARNTELRKVNRPASLTTCAEDAFAGAPFSGLTTDPGTVQLSADGKTLLRYPAGQAAHRYQVPAGVTRIADNAFEGADQLYWIDLPDSLTEIGTYAFRGCTRLSAVYLPDSVRTVGVGAFQNCSSLTILNLSPNLTTVPYQMCDGCASLTSIVLPEGIQILSPNAFANCKRLKLLLLPDSLREMQGQVFEYSLQLDTVIFRDGDVKLDDEALFARPGTDGEFGSLGYPIDGLTVYAPAGTAAEAYAKRSGIAFSALSGHVGLDNLRETETYPGFVDVNENAWYGTRQTGVIRSACRLGIMEGVGGGRFQPQTAITRAEAIKMAAVVHDRYLGGTGALGAGSSPWYHDFLNYALANDMIEPTDFSVYDVPATRAEMAMLFAACLPQYELTPSAQAVTPPDVTASTAHADAIYALYRAGILVGDAGTHAFRPNDSITRAEAAVIIVRTVCVEGRI